MDPSTVNDCSLVHQNVSFGVSFMVCIGGGPDPLEDMLACGTLPCAVVMSGPSHSRQARTGPVWSTRLLSRRYESRPVSPRTASPIPRHRSERIGKLAQDVTGK